MTIHNFVLNELLQALPGLRPQLYFKASLTALSHAMEDQVLISSDPPLVIASFQRERFYKQEAHRYQRLGAKSDQVYILASPETNFVNSSDIYEKVAFPPDHSLAQEWHLVVLSNQYASCLICQERTNHTSTLEGSLMDNSRRFEGIWTFDRRITQQAALILCDRIIDLRPELASKIDQVKTTYLLPCAESTKDNNLVGDPEPFVQRLVTYLQASQHKLLKANRSLAAKENKERLLNSITAAIRRSLDPDEILQVAVQKLGEGLGVCRCVVYRCKETDTTAQISHEFTNQGINSLKGQEWPLSHNPLFQEVVELHEALKIEDTQTDPRLQSVSTDNGVSGALDLRNLVKSCSIFSWLLVPVIYQDRLLGMMELHHCGPEPALWKAEDVALVDAIATQVGVALIQAEAYANLEDLNEQLAALDRTRSNLVAITGHELRTPLSTIQVCLESLASEPDMSPELRQVMLNTALQDSERMRKLVQDFLTLSQLESGRVQWHPEPLSLDECVELAVSHIRSRHNIAQFPQIINQLPPKLPLVQVDGEWLVEVIAKLLDNACKFTTREGSITIGVSRQDPHNLEVTVSDTGRGIEPNRLEKVFDRFYQEEGALRRSAGGTGLGLAICRQIVNNWGGQIWAESGGKNQGSQFHFTIPIVREQSPPPESTPKPKKAKGGSAKKLK